MQYTLWSLGDPVEAQASPVGFFSPSDVSDEATGNPVVLDEVQIGIVQHLNRVASEALCLKKSIQVALLRPNLEIDWQTMTLATQTSAHPLGDRISIVERKRLQR